MSKVLLAINILNIFIISLFVSCKIRETNVNSNLISETNETIKNLEISFNAKKTSDNEYDYSKTDKYINEISLKLILTEDGIFIYEGEKDKGNVASTKLFQVEKKDLSDFKEAIENPNYKKFSIADLSNTNNKRVKIEVSKDDNIKDIIFFIPKNSKNQPKVPFYTFENTENIKKWISDNIKSD